MHERMLDKQTQPSVADMRAWCGEAGELFAELLAWAAKELGTEQKVTFPYGNHYGWSAAQRRKGKLVCHIFAERDALTVMLRLSDRQYQSVYGALLPCTQELIDHRYPCGDGGWIHARVTSREQLEDVKRLLRLK